MSRRQGRRSGAGEASAATREQSPYEESILRSLRRILRGVALYNKHLASLYRITGPQLICIRHLSLAGPATHSQLAAAASLSKPTISGIVDRLEARGIVTRDRTATDRRHVLVRLTDHGRELAFTAPLPLQERFAWNLARLPRGQQLQIDRMLDRIVRMMEVSDLDAAPILEVAQSVADADHALPKGKTRRTGRGRTRGAGQDAAGGS